MARRLRAAPWPHATGLASVLVGLACGLAALERLALGFSTGGAALSLLSLGWFGLAVLCLADAVSRYREYRRIKVVLLRRGYCERILRLAAGSRCQRDAALLAAREAGCGRRARALYHRMGYRWRHVLPDVIVAEPWRFLDPAFLRATFLPGKKIDGDEAAETG